MTRKICEIFGAQYDLFTKQETISRICNAIDSSGPTCHRGDLNVATLVRAHSDHNFLTLINSADIVNLDGMGAVFGARFLGIPNCERITGVDLFSDLLQVACDKGYTVYLLGSTDEVLKATTARAKKCFPNLIIVGSRNGYFFGKEDEVVHQINLTSPSMLFVGIQSPEKESFIYRNKTSLNCRFVMGVGGTFDVFSGKIRRAPVWMQNYGLEWLYRVMQEPGRMWKRYLTTNSQFAWLLVRAKFRQLAGR